LSSADSVTGDGTVLDTDLRGELVTAEIQVIPLPATAAMGVALLGLLLRQRSRVSAK
jgi:uncharacterized protein (TIGR03382 family)